MKRDFFNDRGMRLAAGLAVVVAIPMAVLFYFQFKSLHDIETTSAVVLRQLSSETADSLTRSIEDYLKRPHISVLLRITQARTEPLDLAFIEPVLNDALVESPFVESFFIWTERGPQSNRWLVFDRDSKQATSDAIEQRFRVDTIHGPKLLGRLQELVETRRAIVAFTEEINGRPHYVQAQLRFEGPARERMTSVIGFAVDAEKLRTQFIPAVLRDWLASVQHPSGFPRLETEVLDEQGQHIFASHPGRDEEHFLPVDERSFAIIFFDKELLEFAAPYEQHREIWGLRTSYGPQPISEIVSASTRPQQALMIVLAVAMALGVFLVAGAAAREVRVAELKSNFVASVSHDLKTPLALIQLFAETLELGRVRTPERAQEYYRIINGESKKLTRLIENILDFSRMEAGLRPYRMEPADLSESVRKVLARMNTQFEQGHFTVSTTIEPDLPRILADEGAAEQAIENLLANAMKYSGEAREIEVEARRVNRHIVVSVTDHGIGISRREQGRIFRKFYRVQRELGGGPQGTGLGLAIVDHTMRGHGGFVRVDSEPEQGSTFSLHFPIPSENAFHGTLAESTR
ncbi:MAG TPA: HAMP domain-containing sensor histidine kinase [Vicinamibacterales bacterium]|nr:HAMP domain-containing sensor histidine kinase [Vicinamibacterales bacterium]